MRAFLRWLLGVPDLDLDRVRTIAQRQDELEDELEHLGRRFEKLQGQVTRSWREDRKRDVVPDPDPDPDQLELEDEDETRDEVLRMIAERRRRA